MEPFVIQCTTCRARLKVHDPAVIGQIVECPKCQSFVAVTAPPGTGASPPSAGGLASGAPASPIATAAQPVTKVPAPGATAGRKAAPPPLPKRGSGSSAGISSSSLGRTPAGSSPRNLPSRTAGPWAADGESFARDQAPAASAPGQGEAKQSAASVGIAFLALHRWWIVGTAAGMLGVASIAWMAGRASHSSDMPDSPATEPTISASPEHPANDATGEKSAGSVADSAATSSKPSPSPVSTALLPEKESKPAEPAEAEPAKSSASVSTIKTPAKAPADSVAETATTDSDPPAVAQSAGPPARPAEEATAAPAPPATAQSEVPASDESEPAVPFDPAKQMELMSHLQDKLPALEFTRVPLGQFVSFLSMASTVPMTIDNHSLAAIGKSSKTQVTVKLDDATVEQALKAALEKSGLTFHIEPGRLVISARAPKAK